MNNTSSSSSSLLGLLTIAFVVLKLTGVIAWTWWWVLSPLWLALVLGLFIYGVALILYGLADRYDW